ncbi:MAG: hypothetical protein Kow00129_10060 [Thermoleophilia bacterium]
MVYSLGLKQQAKRGCAVHFGAPPGLKKGGHVATDPVCGETFREREAEVADLYDGRVYFFCSREHREAFRAEPETYARNAVANRLHIGVMGAASGRFSDRVRDKAFELGRAIGGRGAVLITGAAPGLPHDSARGAQQAGGLSVGISPALSLDEHKYVYESPDDAFDVMIYTGSGLMGREIVNIRSSDIVVIINGHSGTLGEFAIAYDEGKLIGVVEGSGGIADSINVLLEAIDKETGAQIVHDSDPENLVDRLVEAYVEGHFRHPSVFEINHRAGGRRVPKG